MLDQTALNVFYHIIGVYQALLIVFGTVGSVFVFIVAYRLRDTTTFVFILFLSVTDALTLFWWNVDDVVSIYFEYWIQEDSLFGCKVLNYFQFVFMQSSAWLLIFLSVDRFLSVWLKSWRTAYFKSKQAFIASTVLVVFFTLLNLNVWFTYGYREAGENGTYTDYCHSQNSPAIGFMTTWNYIHAFLYLYIPYVIIGATNVALIAFLAAKQKMRIVVVTTNSAKKSNVNKMTIAITLLFVLLTFPASMDDLFFDVWIEQEWGLVVVLLCDALDFTYHAMSFPLLMLTNLRFRREFLRVLSSIGLVDPKRVEVNNNSTLFMSQSQARQNAITVT